MLKEDIELLKISDIIRISKRVKILKEHEDLFVELTKSLVMKTDENKYPDYVFWFLDDRCMIEYNKEYGYCNINYGEIRSKFENKFNLNYNEIQFIMKYMVEKHFFFKGITPRKEYFANCWVVEKHFFFKGITP